MITTAEIAPSPLLAPFVRCYSFREFDTKGKDLIKPWHASHEVSMSFFFKAKPLQLINPQTGQIIRGGSQIGVTGLSTQYNGEMTFNGTYAFFEIYFKPNGFTKLVGTPSGEFVNYIIQADDVFSVSHKRLFEQLAVAQGVTQMGALADAFLLANLKKLNRVESKDSITAVSALILQNRGLINIDKLAGDANMSVRNFERKFLEQVGIAPKLFCCITRFSHAFNIKLKYPSIDWTSVATQAGYYDQMHLVKDFKKFAGNAPSTFLKQTPLTGETYTSRIEG
jgi:AraC-like DNA-binding protein